MAVAADRGWLQRAAADAAWFPLKWAAVARMHMPVNDGCPHQILEMGIKTASIAFQISIPCYKNKLIASN
jgi:hypothetical protein